MTHDLHDDRSSATTSTRGHDVAVVLRFLVIAAIVVILVIVAVDNREDVRVGYAIGHKQGPIWVVILCSALAGAVIGSLIKHRPHRR
jgi:uncharacterized integral membrane protein